MSLFLWAHNHARVYAFEEYRGWLEQVGFREIKLLNPRLLTAKK